MTPYQVVTLRNGQVYEGRITKKGRTETRMELRQPIDGHSLTIFPTYAIASIVEVDER